MNRKLFIGIVSCFMAIGLHAETIRVLRFVPVAGAESEVALKSLQKVVFTQDSVVLISATDGEATPMYKYDYQSILFADSSTPTEIEKPTPDPSLNGGKKVIRDGRLYIMFEGRMYDVLGRRVKEN